MFFSLINSSLMFCYNWSAAHGNCTWHVILLQRFFLDGKKSLIRDTCSSSVRLLVTADKHLSGKKSNSSKQTGGSKKLKSGNSSYKPRSNQILISKVLLNFIPTSVRQLHQAKPSLDGWKTKAFCISVACQCAHVQKYRYKWLSLSRFVRDVAISKRTYCRTT